MSTFQKYRIAIDGQSYTISSDEPEAVVLAASEMLNSLLKEVKASCPTLDRYQVVLFAALQLANKITKTEKDIAFINTICHEIQTRIDEELVF